MANNPSSDHVDEDGDTEINPSKLEEPPFVARAIIPAPRPTADAADAEEDKEDLAATRLPPAKDHHKLRLAASDMVEFGISLDEAASHHGVDRDTLHVFYRTYVKFVGKDNVEDPHASYASIDRGDFDRTSHRQFDRNWAEMMFQADRDRPELSALHRWFISSPMTSWMFNGTALDKITVTGAACAIGLGLLAVKLTRNDPEASEEKPAREPAKWNQSNDLDHLDRDQQVDLLDQILEYLTAFIDKKTWEERRPYVRNPDEMAPLMERYHQRVPDRAIAPIIVEPDISFLNRSDGKFALVQAKRRTPGAADQHLVFLIEIVSGDKKFLIDWKVLVNYEPVPWEEFQSAKSTELSPFRVRVSPGDYYNQPFMDEKKFASFQLSFPQRPGEEVFAFAERGSLIDRQLQSFLEGDIEKSRAAILNLRFPQGATLDNIVEVESVAADSW
ncbi:MAG: hypothetical protein ACI8XO_005102 [Verrucomicrobiales bacterium]|jgi:hypothetical protein